MIISPPLACLCMAACLSAGISFNVRPSGCLAARHGGCCCGFTSFFIVFGNFPPCVFLFLANKDLCEFLIIIFGKNLILFNTKFK